MFISAYECHEHTHWTQKQSWNPSGPPCIKNTQNSASANQPMFNDHGLVTWVCLPATSLPYTDKKYVFININKHNYSNDTYLRNIDSENKKPVQMGWRATRAGQRGAAARRVSLIYRKNE